MKNIKSRTVFTGDNLPILRGMESDSVELVYLDPPFNKNKMFRAPIGTPAEGAEFRDIWTLDDIDIAWHDEIEAKNRRLHTAIMAGEVHSPSMKSYLIAMAVRLLELYRIMKPTGSLYYHCDHTASHYLKLLLDAIFGYKQFRNEIVWHYTGGGRSKTYFSRKHDSIFWYSKSFQWTFNIDAVRVPYKKSSGYAKSGVVSATGKRYTPNPLGTPVDDVWDIPIINPLSKERVGYPTQKPLILLDRIIQASSNKDDWVLDPFCGCATTCVAAERLQRRWIGIDISEKANELVRERMHKELGLYSLNIIHRTDIPRRKGHRSKNIKQTLYGKQQGYCNLCQVHFLMVNLTLDHIVPTKHGGLDDDNNLQLLCQRCNSIKGTKTMQEAKAAFKSKKAI